MHAFLPIVMEDRYRFFFLPGKPVKRLFKRLLTIAVKVRPGGVDGGFHLTEIGKTGNFPEEQHLPLAEQPFFLQIGEESVQLFRSFLRRAHA